MEGLHHDTNLELTKELPASNIDNQSNKPDELISEISKYFTLKIGDIIFTGTPSGVGKVNKGDNLEGFIEGKSSFVINVK